MMRQRPRLCMMVAAILASAAAAPAQSAPQTADDTFEPDRPGFTNGSGTTPPGRIVIESGIARTRDQSSAGGTITVDYPEALIRIGGSKNLEYQVGLPDYNLERHGARGFGDAYLGLKIKVYESGDGNTRASVAPGFTLPTGKRDFGTPHVDPSLLFGVDHQTGKVNLAANLVFSDASENAAGGGSGGGSGGGGRNFTVTPAASASYALSEKLSVYLDAFADLPAHGASQTTADGGFAYLVTPDVQLDVEAGHGLAGASPAHFVGAGISFRF